MDNKESKDEPEGIEQVIESEKSEEVEETPSENALEINESIPSTKQIEENDANEDSSKTNGDIESESVENIENNVEDPEIKSNIESIVEEITEKSPEIVPPVPIKGIKRKTKVEELKSEIQVEKVEQKENVDHKTDTTALKLIPGKVDEAPVKSVAESDEMGKGKRARIPNKRYSDIILSPNRRNTSLHKLDISESDSSKSNKDETTPAKRSRQSIREHLQDIKYLKPFKFGWKREVVYQSTENIEEKKVMEIFYYTPDKKKVKNTKEVANNLTGKMLSTENFTFAKDLIGVNDPEKEAIITYSRSNSPNMENQQFAKKISDNKKPKKTTGTEGSKSEQTGARGKRKTMLDEADNEKEVNSNKKITKMGGRKGRGSLTNKRQKLEEPMEVASSVTSPSVRARALKIQQPIQQPSGIKTNKRNLNLKSITNNNEDNNKSETKFMDNFIQNLSFGYNTLLHVFQYLKVQDLLRAGCVCNMWNDLASHPLLWRTVRMKNSQVHSFEGLANALKKHGTVNLDLRKMLLPNNGDDSIWSEFSKAISRVDCLRKIELCRCPASVVEELTVSNPNLLVINSVTIKSENLNLDSFKSLNCIQELRLKATTGLNINSIDSLKELKTLKILSLTSINELSKLNLEVIAQLVNLESLDLGECLDFPKNFGEDILVKLEKLEKLRLEKGQGNCYTFELLESIKSMKSLEQLELVNFDVKSGFDKAIGACTNIKKLMIIPTYISQSATTNNMVLAGVLRLQSTLSHFVWGVTLELLRVTELFVDQCEDSNKKEKKLSGNGDCIPVLKPIPDLTNGGTIQETNNPPEVEILPLPNLQKLLLNSLPTTRVKILKIPFHATWRQTLTDSV